jgi:hypothetical protein
MGALCRLQKPKCRPQKAKTPLGEAGLSRTVARGSGGQKKQPPYLKRTYRAAVSGVFRPSTFLFRHLRQDGGQRFAICGSNPALTLTGYQPTGDAAVGVLSAMRTFARDPRPAIDPADSGSPQIE